jgi:transcriptional regulator GlxA family with amidase domain
VKRSVGVLVFDDVELLDFAGPFEVFSASSRIHGGALFDVFTVATTLEPIRTSNGPTLNPQVSFDQGRKIDVLVIPGGMGSRRVAKGVLTLEWIREQVERSELTMSVCTGVLPLGALGLLNGAPYCTHHAAYDAMKAIAPEAIGRPGERFVCSGKIWSSAGISAGIDLALHLVGKIHGLEVESSTATYLEYSGSKGTIGA